MIPAERFNMAMSVYWRVKWHLVLQLLVKYNVAQVYHMLSLSQYKTKPVPKPMANSWKNTLSMFGRVTWFVITLSNQLKNHPSSSYVLRIARKNLLGWYQLDHQWVHVVYSLYLHCFGNSEPAKDSDSNFSLIPGICLCTKTFVVLFHISREADPTANITPLHCTACAAFFCSFFSCSRTRWSISEHAGFPELGVIAL